MRLPWEELRRRKEGALQGIIQSWIWEPAASGAMGVKKKQREPERKEG